MSAQLAAASLAEFPSPITPTKRPSAKLSHHARCCTICHHADRLEIEDDFLHWRPSTEIAADYGLPDRRAVYRHARAAGLYQRRMRNIRVASSYLVQHADRVTANAKQVLDAVRACSLIDATGTWNEPVRHVIIEHVTAPQLAGDSAIAVPETSPSTPQISALSTVYSVQLESAATPTKQTPRTTSTVYSSAVSPDANLPSAHVSAPVAATLMLALTQEGSPVATRTSTERCPLPRYAPPAPTWLKLCPNFIRDRFLRLSNSRKAASSHRTPPAGEAKC